MNDASSEARKHTSLAMSSGCPRRLTKWVAVSDLSISTLLEAELMIFVFIGVSIWPGSYASQRIPSGVKCSPAFRGDAIKADWDITFAELASKRRKLDIVEKVTIKTERDFTCKLFTCLMQS